MQPYNIEIFDTDFNLIQHYNASELTYVYDYLNTAENSVMVAFNENVAKGMYIRIVNDINDYFGYITGIAVNEAVQGFSEIKYKPFITLFDSEILFDVTDQGGGTSLEQTIADYITAYWINNSDAYQNIYGLSVTTISTTSTWDFHITTEQSGTNNVIINFMTDIIRRALTKYQIGLYAKPDFGNKTIEIEIGRKALNSFTIEADLPNVLEKSIIVNENTVDINKLVIYDQADMSTNVIYYKHPDGTYDTTNSNRISPVIFSLEGVSASADVPFSDAAQNAADKQFDKDSYNNLIEITVQNEDEVVMPSMLTIGQVVSVISNGTSYGSILTGIERSDRTKLIFGTIRLDLTKILKEGMR